MNVVSILLITLATLIGAEEYEIIADHKNAAAGYFSTNLKTTGLENENDPTANTYSIIGTFDTTKQAAYRGDDGAFGFKLVYKYSDGTTDTLIWRQTSWITASTVTGAVMESIPNQGGKASQNQFGGLSLATYSATYIDGSDDHINWFHSVGSNREWGGGIPGDRESQAAYAMTLYILIPPPYEIIADHKNAGDGYFSTNLKNTGLENEDDPTANTYSIIGTFDVAKQAAYRGDDGAFGFKLVYKYSDGTTDTLIWRQTSWITASTVTGAVMESIPNQGGKASQNQFGGLSLATYSATYIDGSDDHINWFHSVGSNREWGGGIPGDRESQAAYAMTLYILNQDQCRTVECAADLVCVDGECVRDCAVLDIDGFLNDCSSQYDSTTADVLQLQSDLDAAEGRITANEAAITALGQEDGAINTRIDGLDTRVGVNEGAITDLGNRLTTAEGNINDNDADIAGLDGRLTTAESDINTNAGKIGAAESEISDINDAIADIQTTLDKLSPSAQSAGSNFMGGNQNFNDYDTDNKSPLIATETKDLVIIFLLALNMVSLCILCTIWMRSRNKYSKYDKVRGYETDENIQLNH